MTDNPIEALKQIRSLCNPMDAKFDPIKVICDNILNNPLRNCDTGTPDEQSERFNEQCARYGYSKYSSCTGCPLEGEKACYFTWGQMRCDKSNKLLDGKKVEIKNSEGVVTVADMIDALRKMPMDAMVCGSEYVEKHDEYDCEVKPFWVAHYNDGSDDGLVYVGIDYKHPN